MTKNYKILAKYIKDISGETVKEIGTHQFTLNLHPEVEMQVTVDVQNEV